MDNSEYKDHVVNTQTDDVSGIDIRQISRIVLAQKWKILLFVALMTALSAVIVSDLPDRYEATSTILVEFQSANPVNIENVYDPDSRRREYLRTQYAMLRSRQVGERVVDKLSLASHPEFLGNQNDGIINRIKSVLGLSTDLSPGPGTGMSQDQVDRLRKQAAVSQFMANLNIDPIPNSQLVNIQYESHYPELSAEIANAIASAYIDSHLDIRNEVTWEATQWMNSRIGELRTKLEASEIALADFKERENLVDLSGVQGLTSQEINGISAQLLDERRRQQGLEALRRQIESKNSDPRKLAEVPDIFNHVQIQSVKSAELGAARQVSELSLRYGPKHPRMIAAHEQLKTAQNNLRSAIHSLVNTIKNDDQTVRANVQSLEELLQKTKGDYQVVSRKEGRYAQLKREVELNEELYNIFLTRLEQTNATADFQKANARITDPAVVPTSASFPARKLTVAATAIGSALLAALMVIGLDLLNQHVRSPAEIEQKLNQRVIGIIPVTPQTRSGKLDLRTYFDSSQFGFSESIRTLRTSLVMSHIEGQGKIIGVTSSIPGEGKSAIATNLAFSLGQLENVLLIDTDMRRPTLAREFSLTDDVRGLSNLINGSSLSECIYRDEESGIDIMPAGPLPDNPQELLGAPRFGEALASLSNHYDRIILDTPPSQVVSDALIVSRLADAMLYVVKADAIKLRTVKGGINRLLEFGAHIDGVVLNQVDTSENSAYYDDYYGFYGEEYRYDDTTPGAAGRAAS
ncbi:GumC family protein [Biformimicrobium ophioploci]|uniref:non-specific protein-tyrosine kinase n=1 Tax=Biformimicrobium ophioploci TaxID=3036711 RepID=A0ABQ6M0A0_9GAMM|nr:polysaccharide biosynthesis tyrosine autokinase [Microbulbifer sp. NKW57]GMG87739.1 exopolysaccharide regulatory tyrosine autokinase VpsO [Microbulbifer sp. NKW57]